MAALTEHPTTGLLNLEKELVCFICTEVLHQPLTLLDCLHTFCGSCLKEWFSHQYRKALNSHSSAIPYTCPTCRAPVKDAQHNAMINTLLDMFLAANPGKARSAEEKAEMAQVYKPGDEILPKLESHRRRERRRREEEEATARERRHTSERSRRDQQLHPGSADHRRPTSGGSRSRERREAADRQRDPDRRPRRAEQLETDVGTGRPHTGGSASSADVPSLSPPPSSPRHPDAVEARQRGARTVAHQASLISLVSASESGTGTGESLSEAQLMQEILAEGLLDGINVDELTEAEQDELSEIIAERYRQLHPERARRTVTDEGRPSSAVDPTSQAEVRIEEADHRLRQSSRSSQRQQTQASPRTSQNVITSETRPPTAFSQSGPEQTLTPPQEASHRRRASNESGRSEPFASRAGRAPQPSGSRTHATRSATDLSDRPQSHAIASERQQSSFHTHRSNTEPRSSPRASESWQAAGSRLVSSPPQVHSPGQPSPRNDLAQPIMSSVNTGPVPTSIPTSEAAITAPEPLSLSASTPSTRFEEPSIECARCSRASIQYEVHKHCAPCKLDLCLRCYRAGRGCNHWFGFGHAAMTKFDSSQPPNRNTLPIELPHMLTGRQYQKPPTVPSQDRRVTMPPTPSDPNLRLWEGNFCDRCGNFANDCFWSCDYCNDGEWGFCNDCVNTNHCCDHPLLPVAHKSFDPNSCTSRQRGAITHPGTVTLSPHTATGRAASPAQSAGSSMTSAIGQFAGLRVDFLPLVITTNCDICSRPISPQETRYHCPGHPTPAPDKPDQKGDFDICISCYHGIVKTGRIKREDGPDGWRLCPDGHRMVVVAFEPDGEGNQHRVVIRDLVGGTKTTEADVAAWKLAMISARRPPPEASVVKGSWTWKEDEAGTRRATRARTSTLSLSGSTATKFPPDGGAGKICRARWSYYPEEGEKGRGELLFPKYASVREIEEINEEWWFGVYAGNIGLFPAIFVKDRV